MLCTIITTYAQHSRVDTQPYIRPPHIWVKVINFNLLTVSPQSTGNGKPTIVLGGSHSRPAFRRFLFLDFVVSKFGKRKVRVRVPNIVIPWTEYKYTKI